MAKKIKNVATPNKARVKVKPGPKARLINQIDNGFGIPNIGFQGSQLSQADTLFKNNRSYLVSNMRNLVSYTYFQHGVIQTIVDVPVDDGLRGGIEIKSKQLSPEQIEELLGELDRCDDLTNVGWGLKWTRLFGGGGLIIVTDQDPQIPFDISTIDEDTPLAFRPFDLWEMYNSQIATLEYGDALQEQEYYDFYGRKIHHSRVLLMKGPPAPSFIKPRLRGWGLSILEPIIRSLNQFLKAADLTFEVLDEFKLDVFKFDQLANLLLQRGGDGVVIDRVRMANMQKNFQHALILDKNDDYEHKQLSFAGLAEVATGIRMQLACDLRMPISKIFGVSSTGFSSGEDDIENYNGMVESQVRQKSKYHILRVVEIRAQKLFGMVPEDLQISFKPLRVLSAEQEENVKTQKFNRILGARSARELTSDEFRDAINKDQLIGIQLEKDAALELEAEKEAEQGSDDQTDEKPKEASPSSKKPSTQAPDAKT